MEDSDVITVLASFEIHKILTDLADSVGCFRALKLHLYGCFYIFSDFAAKNSITEANLEAEG